MTIQIAIKASNFNDDQGGFAATDDVFYDSNLCSPGMYSVSKAY